MSTAPDQPAPAADSGLADRVGRLEDGQATILGRLDQLISGGQAPAAPAAAERPEVGISQEIRDGLAAINSKLDKQAPAAPAKEELAEQAPVAPARWIERKFWGAE